MDRLLQAEIWRSVRAMYMVNKWQVYGILQLCICTTYAVEGRTKALAEDGIDQTVFDVRHAYAEGMQD